MSKFVKFLAIAALVGGAFAMTPAPAAAQHHHHPAVATGMAAAGVDLDPALSLASVQAWGWGGYPYYAEPYYAGPACGWARVRVWRHGHWVLRRAWRCW